MAGYSPAPLWKKLGYKDGLESYVDGAPVNYLSLLTMPVDLQVTWLAGPRSKMSFVHLFSVDASELKRKLRTFKKQIVPDGVIWVSWPKKSSGVATDITEEVIREAALPLGLVDIKVCAVDDVWSGLKLMIRKELR